MKLMSVPKINEILTSIFEHLGFSEKEVKVYSVLLEKGHATAGEIIKSSGLKRGITYAVLYELEEKGLLTIQKKEKKTFFQLESPQKLLELVKLRKQEVATLEDTLSHSMTQLMSRYKLAVDKPVVQYFQGEEGIKELFNKVVSKESEAVYGCVDVDTVEEILPAYNEIKIVPTRIKNKVKSYAIMTDMKEAREIQQNDDKELRETVLVDKKDYPLPAEIDVFGDKIAMMSFKKGDFIGLMIENKDFAESLRSIFKLAHISKKKK